MFTAVTFLSVPASVKCPHSGIRNCAKIRLRLYKNDNKTTEKKKKFHINYNFDSA